MFSSDAPAVGVIEVDGYVAMAATVEAMTKGSSAKLLGFQRSGGVTMLAVVEGDLADVEYALEAGTEAARQAGVDVQTSVLVQGDAEVGDVLSASTGVHPLPT